MIVQMEQTKVLKTEPILTLSFVCIFYICSSKRSANDNDKHLGGSTISHEQASNRVKTGPLREQYTQQK